MAGIRIPPGGHVTLEITPETMQVIQDPIGGPPIEVSHHVMPDAMLSISIIECTRALESHEAEIQKTRETHLRVEAAYNRTAWWSKAVVIGCGVLVAVSLGNFVTYMWGLLHGH